jgi:hypothetical protein
MGRVACLGSSIARYFHTKTIDTPLAMDWSVATSVRAGPVTAKAANNLQFPLPLRSSLRLTAQKLVAKALGR